MPIWTFEQLAQADRKTLEEVLLSAQTPDLAQLNGRVYDGYNHERFGQLPGEKFRKAFYQRDHAFCGFNQVVAQDGQRYLGVWQTKMKRGQPVQLGYYHVAFAKDAPLQKRFTPYMHLVCLNYNVSMNSHWNVALRGIRDFVGLPNAGDHSLLLGKAYIQVAPWLAFFASYFILGHPQALDEG